MKNIKISDEAHTKIIENFRYGETFADVLDRLLGITASNNISTKRGSKKQ